MSINSLITKYFTINDVKKRYLLIFRHNLINNDFFTSYEEFLETNSLDKFSILGSINDSYKTINNSFEFILEYPETSKYANWIQNKNPIYAEETEVIGFKEIEITWPKSDETKFIGLHKSKRTEKCFVEGTIGKMRIMIIYIIIHLE